MTLPKKVAAADEKKKIIVHPDQIILPDRRPWSDRPLEDVVVRFVLMSALFIGLSIGAGILVFAVMRRGG